MTIATARAPRQSAGRAGARASAVPMIIGLGAVVASLAIALLVILLPGLHGPRALFFDAPLPLVLAEVSWLSWTGYALTPFVVIACYGWDATVQRAGLRRDPNFQLQPRFATALRWLMGAGFLLGIWHILNLSVALADVWGLS